MFSSRSVQIAAVFLDVFGQALPNLCRSFYNETKAEMFFSVFAVALLAEGVDRNSLPQLTAYSALHPGIVNLSPIGLIVRGAKQKQKAA